MAYSLTWLPEVLKNAGLNVNVVDGWENRGHGDIGKIYGVLCHHTNGAKTGNMPSLQVLVDGRPDLAGPLVQLGLGRDGTYYLVAAGKGWHAGAGEWKGLTDGNSHLIGIEAENVGDGTDPWPDVQMDAYRRGVAAILAHIGATSDWAIGHKEWAPSRKDDPNFDMGKFRTDVAALMKGNQAPEEFADSGKGSWYSQYKGKYTWIDKQDKPNSDKLGVPDWAQGISFYNQSTLGDWFEVRYPNGFISIEQQTDIGPNPRTGRSIDISAVAAERAGYSPNNFPTDSIFSWRPIPTPALVEAFTKKDQAVAYAKQRLSAPVAEPTTNLPVKPRQVEEIHNLDEAFAWAAKAHLKVQSQLLKLMKDMQAYQQPDNSEIMDLIEEIKPVLLRNMNTLLPIIWQLHPSTIGKLVALGLTQVAGPANVKGTTMDNSKPWYQSIGVWGSIGAVALPIINQLLKTNLTTDDFNTALNLITAIGTSVSGLLALWGRVRATTTITATKN